MIIAGRIRAACGAVPQTAVIPIVTRRYSSVLLNFAAHSPEDSQANATGYMRDGSLSCSDPYL
jgi:hypothetical protein